MVKQPITKESEKVLEKKLRNSISKAGGTCLKWVSPGFNGVPDRIILMPGGRIFFAEIKSTGKKLRPIQVYVKDVLEKLGLKYFIIDSTESLEKAVYEICST